MLISWVDGDVVDLINTADKGCDGEDENATKACVASEGKNLPSTNT